MEFNRRVNVNISNQSIFDKTYNIVTLKPNNNILTQEMVQYPYTKYIIIYNFDLDGEIIEIPDHCILEINGGDIFNGTLIGNDTIVINTNNVDILKNNISTKGTWKSQLHTDIIYLAANIQNYLNMENTWFAKEGADGQVYLFVVFDNIIYNISNSGQGLILRNTLVTETDSYIVNNLPEEARQNSLSYTSDGDTITITLPDGSLITNEDLNNTEIVRFSPDKLHYDQIPTLTQDMFQKPNTKYVISYDYTLNGKTIQIPENCTLVFDEGNIINGTLEGNDTILINLYRVKFGANMTGTWNNMDFFHEVLTEEDFEHLSNKKKKKDTIYLIIES